MKSEQLEDLIQKIRKIQSIMVDVSTGGSLIQEREDEYNKVEYYELES